MSEKESAIIICRDSGSGSTLLYRWQCLRCGAEGAWIHTGQVTEGIPGGHLCLAEMKRRIEDIDTLVASLEDALRRRIGGGE